MRGRTWLVLALLALLIGIAAWFYPFDRTPPTVAAAPAPGSYREEIRVTLTAGEPDAEVWYAQGEGEPLRYLGPIPLRRDASLRYYAVDRHGNRSPDQLAAYSVRIDNTPPVTTVNPPGGRFFNPVAVSLSTEEGAVIRYTTDGSEPTAASPAFEAPLPLDQPTTLRFCATDAAGNCEEVRTEQYEIIIDNTKPYTLVEPAGGVFNRPLTVKLTVTKPNSRIHLTTDGSKPTAKSPLYQAPVTMARSGVLRFFAVDEPGNVEPLREERYIIDTVPPSVSASPRGGAGNRPLTVALSSSEAGGIRWSLEGDADGNSPLYQGPVRVERSGTLTFFAVDSAGNKSALGREEYVIDTVPPVTAAKPPGGTFGGKIRVKLESSEPADIYYTLDGSDPTTASPKYQGALAIDKPLIIAFFAVDRVGNREPVRREKYGLDMTPPRTIADPAGGAFEKGITVTLRADQPGAVIRYTLDGKDPDDRSPVYSSPLAISRETPLKFFAVAESGGREQVRLERYTFDTTAPITVIDPAPGTYDQPISVSLKNNKGADIFVKVGNAEFAPYSGPFVLQSGGKVSYYSRDVAGNSEAVRTAEYLVDSEAPSTLIYPAPGEYNPPIALELLTEEGAKVHYTLDGTEPSLASPVYSGGLALRDGFTVKFFAVDAAGNRERTRTASYVVRSGMWRDFTNGVFIHPSVFDGDFLWVGEPEGLFRVKLSNRTREHFTTDDGLISDAIRALAVDRLGFKWVGTDKGLAQFDGRKNWVTLDYSDGMASNEINCIVIDVLQNKWIGTDRGLSMYNGKTFTNYGKANGFPDDTVNALAIDPNATFWVGTRKGLVKWDTRRAEKVFTRADGLPGDDVTAVAVDGRWNVWVGTRENGVARYDGKRWTVFGPDQGIWGTHILTIAVDLGDNKWFSTDQGVFKYDGRAFTKVDMPVYK